MSGRKMSIRALVKQAVEVLALKIFPMETFLPLSIPDINCILQCYVIIYLIIIYSSVRVVICQKCQLLSSVIGAIDADTNGYLKAPKKNLLLALNAIVLTGIDPDKTKPIMKTLKR